MSLADRQYSSRADRSNEAARSNEDGRRRQASSPTEIQPRGWKKILIRVYNNIGEDRVFLVGAGVTFYSLLAIFPAIAAMVALYGFFADPSDVTKQVDTLSGVLPGGAIDVIRDQLNRLVSQGQTKLGFAFLVSFSISLWSANAGMKSMFDALNIVYKEREKRGFFKLNLVALAFTVGAILFVLVALGGMIVVPALFSWMGAIGPMAVITKIVRWPLLLAIITVALAVLYRYGPSRSEAQWRWITWGSAFAAVAWIVVSILFSWYAENYGSYNRTYGSLGAVVGFMVWIWLSSAVVLIGAELDAAMEHQTGRDTTTGENKPFGRLRIGERGA